MRKQIYVGELDRELWADFQAAVVKRYGHLRTARGPSTVTKALADLLVGFIADVESGLKPRAHANIETARLSQKDKISMLYQIWKNEGSDYRRYVYQIHRSHGYKDPRTCKNALMEILEAYEWPPGFKENILEKNTMWKFGPFSADIKRKASP